MDTARIRQIFGDRLYKERIRKRMTQTALAECLTGELSRTIHSSAVALIEKGKRAVKLDEAIAIAEVLDVPLIALITAQGKTEVRIRELQRDLEQQKDRAKVAQSQLQHVQSVIAHIQLEIEKLKAAR